jgi:hypothetical protein
MREETIMDNTRKPKTSSNQWTDRPSSRNGEPSGSTLRSTPDIHASTDKTKKHIKTFQTVPNGLGKTSDFDGADIGDETTDKDGERH